VIIDCPAPPKLFVEPTSIPEFKGTTYRDLGEYTLELKHALEQCNIDKGLLNSGTN
jgi:hypothetical protein